MLDMITNIIIIKRTLTKKRKNMFKMGEDYNFEEISEFAGEEYDMQSLGTQNVMGEEFLVLGHNDKDVVISFVLTGYTNGYIYTCVYSDLKGDS